MSTTTAAGRIFNSVEMRIHKKAVSVAAEGQSERDEFFQQKSGVYCIEK